MSAKTSPTQNRREFFRASARYSLAVLLALAAALAARGRGPGGQPCINRGICGTCSEFEGCGLPQALSAKRARRS